MPRGDGVPNLIKFGSNIPGDLPLTASNTVLQPGSGESGIPWVGLVSDASGNVLAIQYLRRRDGAVTYAPEFSSDLINWNAVGGETITGINTLWERVTVKDEPPPGAKSRFGRVRFVTP